VADYFTKETDKALAAFLSSDDDVEKHAIFNDQIRPAFEKLIENLIYVYGFYNIDEVETLKRDCLANLYEMIPKYNPDRGTKGFSYFNVVAKNWFIMKTRERTKRNKLESDVYLDLDHEVAKNDPNFSISPHEDDLEEREKWMHFYSEMDGWRTKLTKKTEKQVLEAVIFIIKNPDLISIFNKKAVYLYLRELTGLNTKQVVVNLKKIKSLYAKWHESYFSTGESVISN
jgi:hypothetical protein